MVESLQIPGLTQSLIFAGVGAASGAWWCLSAWLRKPETDKFRWKLFAKEVVASLVIGASVGFVSDSWMAAFVAASAGEEALNHVSAYKGLGK